MNDITSAVGLENKVFLRFCETTLSHGGKLTIVRLYNYFFVSSIKRQISSEIG